MYSKILIAINFIWINRKKEMGAFQQRNSMSISVINDINDRMSNNYQNRKTSQNS